jgi:hypothetical protein
MAQHFDFVMDLPQDYYAAIGEFMFRTAQLEMQLHEILWRAISIDNKQGRVLTVGREAGADIRRMLNTVISEKSAGRWLSPKTAEGSRFIREIESLTKDAKDFIEFRNNLAHGAWQSPVGARDSRPQLLFMKTSDEKILARFDAKIDADHIRAQCTHLRALNLKAQRLLIDPVSR